MDLVRTWSPYSCLGATQIALFVGGIITTRQKHPIYFTFQLHCLFQEVVCLHLLRIFLHLFLFLFILDNCKKKRQVIEATTPIPITFIFIVPWSSSQHYHSITNNHRFSHLSDPTPPTKKDRYNSLDYSSQLKTRIPIHPKSLIY